MRSDKILANWWFI